MYFLVSFAAEKKNVLISGHELLNDVTASPSLGIMNASWPAVWNRFDTPGLVVQR